MHVCLKFYHHCHHHHNEMMILTSQMNCVISFSIFWKNFFFLIYFIYSFLFVFVFGCVGSLLRVGFLQLRRAGATLHCGSQTSHRGGFSCCGAQALGARASVVVACGLSSCGSRALEHRVSSCGSRA